MPFPNLNGRPTEYTEDIPAQAENYLIQCKVHDVLPKRAGFAIFLGIHRDTLYEWEKKYPQLSDVLKYIDTLQEENLWNGALNGDYNAVMAKLMLTNRHGYSDRSEVKQESKIEITDISDPQKKLEMLKAKIAEHEAHLKADHSA